MGRRKKKNSLKAEEGRLTMEELRVDMRERSPELQEFYNRQEQLTFKLNHTMPRTEDNLKNR